MDQIVFHGTGLHTGAQCAVGLRRRSGGLAFVQDGHSAALDELSVVRADRGVQVRSDSGLEVDLVEHLLAAMAGLSIRRGLEVELTGPEVPLLDGGALEISRALGALDPPRDPPGLRVAQAGDIHVDGTRYVFEPGDAVEIEVDVEFRGVGPESARWSGDANEFLLEIAPARTFGYSDEADQLRETGRAGYVDPRAVIVLEPDGSVAPPGEPPGPAELARHKLLDLLGDLYLFGGPPLGRLRASRPGHARNQRAMRQALEYGLLEPLEHR